MKGGRRCGSAGTSQASRTHLSTSTKLTTSRVIRSTEKADPAKNHAKVAGFKLGIQWIGTSAHYEPV